MKDFVPFRPLDVALVGTNVVNASAGTGKTYAITTLFVRLLLEKRLDVSEILVVTFTDAATAELRSRIRGRLQEAVHAFRRREQGQTSGDGELDAYAKQRSDSLGPDVQRLSHALQNVDEAPISTIHGFCQRMLHDSAFESGVSFEVELAPDLQPLRDEVLHDFWALTMSDASDERLSQILDAGLVPSGCRGLADKATRNPDMPVLPKRAADVFQGAVAEARAAWDPDGVLQAITQHAMKPQPQQRTLKRWFEEIEEFLGRTLGLPPDKLPNGIVGLSRKKLAERCPRRPPAHPFFEACDQLVAACSRHRKQSPEVLTFKKQLIEYVREQIPRRQKEAGTMSFDDLLYLLCGALRGPAGAQLAEVIRTQFKAALIDEFQDTDPVQFAIFRAVYGATHQPLFLIGDPKQAIYAFRGADVFAFLQAIKATDNQKHTMAVNWRSDRSLVAAINELFRSHESCQRPFVLEGIDYPPVEPRPKARNVFQAAKPFCAAPLEFLFIPREEREKLITKGQLDKRLPRLVAGEISALMHGGGTLDGKDVEASDVAVLTSTNAQSFEIQDALRELQIPAVVLGTESVFQSREAGDLERVLAAVVEPTSAHELRKAITTELLGVTANELAEMETNPAQWDRWANLVREWHALWSEKGFIQMFQSLMADSRMQQRLLGLVDGERRMTNLLHLSEALHTVGKKSHLGPAGLLRWLSLQRSSATVAADQSEIRLESDAAAVTISTIHKAKGLEYAIVYCPYLWDGKLLHAEDETVLRFHDDDGRLTMDLGSLDFEAHKARAELYEALAENLRLLYVALTRAKHRCSVVWGLFRHAETSALSYLLHPPTLDQGEELTIFDLKGRLESITDEEMLDAIRARSQACAGAMDVRIVARDSVGDPVPREEEATDERLEPREVDQKVARWWRMTSYSSLTSRRPVAALDDTEGRDRDELSEQAEEAQAEAAPPMQQASTETTTKTPDPSRILLADFPRGTKAGNFLHEIFERLDFQHDDAIGPLVRPTLASYRYDAKLTDTVCQSVRQILTTPLLAGEASFTLGDVPLSRRLNELEFHLPVAGAALGASSAEPTPADEAGATRLSDAAALTPYALARAFARHPSGALVPEYADRLRHLPFFGLHGFLRGFVDLVFEHDGRFYLVDYKSNHLGDRLDDYGSASMQSQMKEGHYYLQYHLYTVAVHRYLERRLPSYDYDQHFGGVLYLFLRGMTPRTGAERGVFFEKPPLGRVQALSDALAGKPKRRGA